MRSSHQKGSISYFLIMLNSKSDHYTIMITLNLKIKSIKRFVNLMKLNLFINIRLSMFLF